MTAAELKTINQARDNAECTVCTPRRGRSIVFNRPGEPLVCKVRDVAEPSDDELLIRITHAGVAATCIGSTAI